jgi:hypothetical protein
LGTDCFVIQYLAYRSQIGWLGRSDDPALFNDSLLQRSDSLQRAGHLVLGIEQFEQFAPSRRCFKMCAIRRDVIPQSLGANK